VDSQGSLSEWWNERAVETPLFAQSSLESLPKDVVRLRKAGISRLIIDTPPAIEQSIASVVALSDIVIIPSRPSPHDLRSIGATVEVAEHLGKPFVFVLNAATPRARITGEAVTVLSRYGMLAPVIVHQRVDFASSMIDGRTVMELSEGKKSSEEIRRLWDYLNCRLEGRAYRSAAPVIPLRSHAKNVSLFAQAGLE
jgi:chromosome partitioning protein